MSSILITTSLIIVTLVEIYLTWLAFQWRRNWKTEELLGIINRRVHREYCDQIEKTLADCGASSENDLGASTVCSRIHMIAADRDLALAQKQNMYDKLCLVVLRLQQSDKRVVNLNAEINNEVAALTETPGFKLAETMDLPSLTHHANKANSGDWQLLEEYQKKAKLPMPDGVYLTLGKHNDRRTRNLPDDSGN